MNRTSPVCIPGPSVCDPAAPALKNSLFTKGILPAKDTLFESGGTFFCKFSDQTLKTFTEGANKFIRGSRIDARTKERNESIRIYPR